MHPTARPQSTLSGFVLLPVLVVALLAVGCASLQRPPFQPKTSDTDFGYKITKSAHKWIFKVETTMPSKVDERFAVLYAYRAVGEECLKLGYKYFDIGVNTTRQFDGYCYASADKDGLGIEFTALGLSERPQKFVIADLNTKTKTQLQVKDELIEIQDQPITSLAHIKAEVARVILQNGMLIDLKVNRDKLELKVKEPIAVFKNSALGSEVLELARDRAP